MLVPLAFTVVTANNGITGSVTDQMIYEQINVLNAAYGGTAPMSSGVTDPLGSDSKISFYLYQVSSLHHVS